MAEFVTRTVSAGIATITLNRPEARNALSLELIEALDRAVEAVASDASVRVMVLAGEGKSFCAGMDLKGVLADPVRMGTMLRTLAMVTLKIRGLVVPTIARVQGAAMGGGCGLLIVPDFAVTHPEAKLGYPEVSLGVCPAVVAPWLIRKIGAGRARAMLIAGGTIDGSEAHRIGLASHLCELEELDATVDALTRSLLAGGAEALSETKRWLNELDGSTESEAVLLRGADLSAKVIQGEEAQSRLRKIFGG
jgi:methylglutaconyl-CoA hydratase